MATQIVILAAGKGMRMAHAELPKVLVPLKGKPLISYLLNEVNNLNLDSKPIIVIGHKNDLVEKALGPNYFYAFQEDQLGTAHAVMAAKKYVTAENVVILYGDMPFIRATSLTKLIERHKDRILTMFTVTAPHTDFARIIRDSSSNIVKIKEFIDCSEEEQNISEVNPGIYIFNAKWLWENINKIAKNDHGEYFLTDIVHIAVEQGIAIESMPIEAQEVFGINTPEHLEQAHNLL